MRKSIFIILAVVLVSYLTGCSKKPVDESQELMSMESISTINAETKATPEAKMAITQSAPMVSATVSTPVKLESLPPTGPYKPTIQEIQTALVNSGFYKGEADGKMGPMTKKAIEAFQKANGLQADGRVGPKTWALLSTYLAVGTKTKQR